MNASSVSRWLKGFFLALWTFPLLADSPAESLREAARTLHGDAWKGQKVFFDVQHGGCIQCHAVAGYGGRLGPDLTTVGMRLNRSALLEALLEPSKQVAPAWRLVELELPGGARLEGLIQESYAGGIRLLDRQGLEHIVPKGQIQRRKRTSRSWMPERCALSLAPEPFVDLVAYCDSLKSDPRKFERKTPPAGFKSWFNGRDLLEFKPTSGWEAQNGILRHLGRGDHLWHRTDLRDFELRFEWRWMDAPKWESFPVIASSGYELQDKEGKPMTERVLDSGDSGVLLRGLCKAQANLFCYPVGSGEFWEYREAAVGKDRVPFTPRVRADRPVGQWNQMTLRLVGNRVSIWLNGIEVVNETELPGLPAKGPIGFQHEHGRFELRHLWVKEF